MSSEVAEEGHDEQNDALDLPPPVSDDTENLYINNTALMGNVFDKFNETKVKVPMGTDPMANMSNCYEDRLKEKPNPSMAKAEEQGNKIERPVSPDVRALASQFENKHLQHAVKPTSKGAANNGKIQMNGTQSRAGTADPFLYSLAKDIPESTESGIKPCINCRSVAMPSPECQLKSIGSQSSGYCSNDPNIPVTLNVEHFLPKFNNFSEELSHRLNRRHGENLHFPNVQDHNARVKLIPETENTETDINMVGKTSVDSEVSMEDTIYDSVYEMSNSLKGFEVISKDPHISSGKTTRRKSQKSRRSRNLLNEGEDYDWKRKEAKKKSRTLKRSPKSGKKGRFDFFFSVYCCNPKTLTVLELSKVAFADNADQDQTAQNLQSDL